MAEGYFDPLPKSELDLDKIKQWVQNNVNTFRRTIAMQGDIQSANFVDGSTGWRLRSNGNVQINGDFLINGTNNSLGYLTMLASTVTTDEGGEIAMLGYDTHPDWFLDVFQTTWRLRGAADTTEIIFAIDGSANVVAEWGDDGQYRVQDGSASVPSLSFITAGQQDVGFYRAGTDEIGVAAGGAEVARFTADGINGGQQFVEEATDQTGITSATYAAGSVNCGLDFVAPASGKVWITVGGAVSATLSGNVTRRCELSWELREGSTVGSGTVVVAADLTRSVAAGVGATSGQAVEVYGSHRYQVTGLTPGDAYNVRTMHRVNIASSVTGAVIHRNIAYEPAL